MIERGMVVRLRGLDGPKMLVDDLRSHTVANTGYTVHCVWYKTDLSAHGDWFKEASLEVVSGGEASA